LHGKSTSILVENTYEKIKNLKSIQQFTPGSPHVRKRLINVHKRLFFSLRHVQS
jgi:hypothetical protein